MLAHDKPDGARISLEQLLHAHQVLYFVPALRYLEKEIVFFLRRALRRCLSFFFRRGNRVQTRLDLVLFFYIILNFFLGGPDPALQHGKVLFMFSGAPRKLFHSFQIRVFLRLSDGKSDHGLCLRRTELGNPCLASNALAFIFRKLLFGSCDRSGEPVRLAQPLFMSPAYPCELVRILGILCLRRGRRLLNLGDSPVRAFDQLFEMSGVILDQLHPGFVFMTPAGKL